MWILSFPYTGKLSMKTSGDLNPFNHTTSLQTSGAGKIFSISIGYPIIILVVILFSLTWYF